MAILKRGTKVRVKKSTLEGEVVGYKVSDDESIFEYTVNYTDIDDESGAPVAHQRRFREDQLIVVEGA